jgi:hypothetical protein
VKEVLNKGAYSLVDFEGNTLASLEMGFTSISITHRWVALGDLLYICIVCIHLVLSFCFMDVSLFMPYFLLWHISSESKLFFGFADGAR